MSFVACWRSHLRYKPPVSKVVPFQGVLEIPPSIHFPGSKVVLSRGHQHTASGVAFSGVMCSGGGRRARSLDDPPPPPPRVLRDSGPGVMAPTAPERLFYARLKGKCFCPPPPHHVDGQSAQNLVRNLNMRAICENHFLLFHPRRSAGGGGTHSQALQSPSGLTCQG